MNYAKLDAALIAALEGLAGVPEHPLSVFVHLSAEPSEAEAAVLSRLGLQVPGASRNLTAHVLPKSIEELSEQSCIRFIQLAQPLNLLAERPSGSPEQS